MWSRRLKMVRRTSLGMERSIEKVIVGEMVRGLLR